MDIDFRDQMLLNEHFNKHRGDFRRLRNANDYEHQAERFVRAGCDMPKQCCNKENGDTIMYDLTSRELAIFSEPQGLIRTYHKRTRKQAEQLFAQECV